MSDCRPSACGPSVVLKTSWMSPFMMASTICGRPSSTLLTFSVGTPLSVRKTLRARGGHHLEAKGE